jgi:hypothetical protein
MAIKAKISLFVVKEEIPTVSRFHEPPNFHREVDQKRQGDADTGDGKGVEVANP